MTAYMCVCIYVYTLEGIIKILLIDYDQSLVHVCVCVRVFVWKYNDGTSFWIWVVLLVDNWQPYFSWE